MTTPEQYFERNQDVPVLIYSPSARTTFRLKEESEMGYTFIQEPRIDWTGYDRTLAYNPHFRWGKRRERVRSSNDCTYTLEENVFQFPKDSHPDSKRGVVMNGEFIGLCPTEDLFTAYQIARLISRAVRVYNAPAHRDSGDADSTESPDSAHWRCPSEGGGFQRYEEGDENTKIPTPFDMLYDDGEITTHEGDPTRYAFSPNFAWRPHFEEGGAE